MNCDIQDGKAIIDGNPVKIPGNLKPSEVREVKGIGLIMIGPEADLGDNVFAFDETGTLLWRIEAYYYKGGIGLTAEQRQLHVDPYIAIYPREDDQILLSTWNGAALLVDMHTGKITKVLRPGEKS